ncbi:hypothetical protein GCM10010151_17720 [Actinoallomurus spadix]|uniref:Superoxide dismutase n=1 Tax=Actinoallomurus spadix TaxID=79912 RepID=A0ABP3FY94_9ACTN
MTRDHDLTRGEAGAAAYEKPVARPQDRQHRLARDLDRLHVGYLSARGKGTRSSVCQRSMIRNNGRDTQVLARLLRPRTTVSAHCDLPCGVYDPAQARIEAESIKAIIEKYQANDDPVFRARALIIKEERSQLVKHHLWVLWTDYFKPPHFEKYPQLHQLFNEATKLAGAAGTKGTLDVAKADELLAKIDEIAKIFWETKNA